MRTTNKRIYIFAGAFAVASLFLIGCAIAQETADVRVEPKVQCYQFTAESDKCQREQTWFIQWTGSDPCAVDVWVADGIVPCLDFDFGEKKLFKKLRADDLRDITISVNGKVQVLTEALNNNSRCNAGWLRFVDPETGCNVRCYTSGGKRYCY